MKRDFLKGLGIEDKEIIDKILDENSADIGRAKGELDTWKTKASDLEKDIKTKDDTIAQLQKEADKVEGLNQTISQLQTDKTNLETELNTKVSEITRDHEIENKIRDRKGLNVKAIKALLDKEKDIDEQLDALVSAEDSSMLFGTTVQAPAGTHPANPNSGNAGKPSTSDSFAEAVAKALQTQNNS
jgi:DNA repair exonuclease SbcCD ATPase subunit